MAGAGNDITAKDAALAVRVDAVERDVGHIENQVNAIRDAMATRTDMATLLARIDALATQQTASSRPNYALMVSIVATAMVFLTMIGGFAYWPINTATGDLKLAVIAIADKMVLQRQYDADSQRLRADTASLRVDLTTAMTSTIQQQRYNADKNSRDDEIKILRERFDKVLARSEFDNQHGDFKAYVAAQIATRERQLDGFGRRLERLENLRLQQAP